MKKDSLEVAYIVLGRTEPLVTALDSTEGVQGGDQPHQQDEGVHGG